MERNKKHYKSSFKEQPHVKDGFMEYSKNYSSILPSPAILESYEELCPGFIEKILDRVKEEQHNRHKIEAKKLKNARSIAKLRQLIHLAIACIVIYATFILSTAHGALAAVVCVTGFGFLLLVHTSLLNIFFKQDARSTSFNNPTHRNNTRHRPYPNRNRTPMRNHNRNTTNKPMP